VGIAEQLVGDIKTLPKELVDFARRQVVNAMLYKGHERRVEGRYPMMLPVHAVWVDENNEPIGESFDLITRDMSSTGIALIHTRPINRARRLAIHFFISDTEVNLIIEMIWSRDMGPFYGAAGRFVAKLDHFPG
jgi:hypothetical protein